MADTKISGLPAATFPLGSTDLIPVVQGGETRRVYATSIGGGAALHPGYAADRFYAPYPAAMSGNSGNTNIQYFVPFVLPVAVTITQLMIVTGQAVGGATIKGAMYSTNRGKPSAILAQTSDMSTASSGAKTFTLGTPLTLAAGSYWMASVCSASVGQHSYNGNGPNFYYAGFTSGGESAYQSSQPASLTANGYSLTADPLITGQSTFAPVVYFKVAP